MAKQKSIIKLEGTLGDITFVKTRDGYLAREKTSLNGEKIATDPAFQRTRENNAEFATAGKAGKLLRTAFQLELQDSTDSRAISRLTKAMIKVLQQDSINSRGLRSVSSGNIQLLEGFDFNLNSKLTTTLYAPYTCTVNRTTGILDVDLADFIPNQVLSAPHGTTHFKIASAGAEIDFVAGTFNAAHDDSGLLPYGSTSTGAISLSNSITPNSTQALFVILGINFYQEVNGVQYPLRNGAYNPLTIIKVSNA